MAKQKDSGLASVLAKYSAEKEVQMIKTGILPFDKIMGGGICPGGMYAFWGVSGCGKSTLAVQIAKSFCKQGMRVAWIDVEKALNINSQISFGIREYVENGTFILLAADSYGQADEITTAISQDKEMDIKLVIVDSETQLLPKIGVEVDVESLQPGTKARQASTWLTKMKSLFYTAGISSIVLSHARANITMMANPYTPKEKMAGGFALQHVPDAILKLSAGSKLGDKDSVEGVILHMNTDKNKYASPFHRYDAKMYFGKGINNKQYMIDWALNTGVIDQNGAYFIVNGTKIHGIDSLYNMSDQDLAYVKEQYEAMNPDQWSD